MSLELTQPFSGSFLQSDRTIYKSIWGLAAVRFLAQPERPFPAQQLKGLLRLDALRYLSKIRIDLVLSHGDGLEEQRFSIHLDIQRGQLPVSRSHVLLLDKERAALVQVSQQSPSEPHRAGQLPFDFRDAFLLTVYQQTSLHMVKDLGRATRGTEIGIGGEFQLDEIALHAGVLKSTGVREHFQQLSFQLAVLLRLFPLLAHLVWIIQHFLNALILGLALLGIQLLAVHL